MQPTATGMGTSKPTADAQQAAVTRELSAIGVRLANDTPGAFVTWLNKKLQPKCVTIAGCTAKTGHFRRNPEPQKCEAQRWLVPGVGNNSAAQISKFQPKFVKLFSKICLHSCKIASFQHFFIEFCTDSDEDFSEFR